MICAAAIGGVLTLSSAGVAYADTTESQVSTEDRVYSTMYSVGFDESVAAANGYEIRTNSAGEQYSVLAGTSETVSTLSLVTGTCGSSWVYEDAVGSLSVILETGFNVYTTPVAAQWVVTLDDNGGTSTKDFSKYATSADWTKAILVPGLTAGYASAVLKSNGSNFAVLIDGNVCYSGGPSASTYIY